MSTPGYDAEAGSEQNRGHDSSQNRRKSITHFLTTLLDFEISLVIRIPCEYSLRFFNFRKPSLFETEAETNLACSIVLLGHPEEISC